MNTLIKDIIDINKVGIKLEHSNQKRGEIPTIMHFCNKGVYNRDKKICSLQFMRIKIIIRVGMNYGRMRGQLFFHYRHFFYHHPLMIDHLEISEESCHVMAGIFADGAVVERVLLSTNLLFVYALETFFVAFACN